MWRLHCWLWLLLLPLGVCAAPLTTLTVAYVGPAGSDSEAGARQGIEEANAQGKFLGLAYQLTPVTDIPSALATQAVAILSAAESADLVDFANAARDIAVINVSAEDDALRSHCSANLFHTIPSRAMRVDAVKQWQDSHPGSQAEGRAWHASAEKYAGIQLNKRYSDRTGRPMSDQAWAAWAAVKLLSDTSARQHALTPATLLTALRAGIAFDGQKGVDLSFRDNGQLRQPLLLIEHDIIVGEAPVHGVANDHGLDSLGPAHCTAQ